MKYKVYQVGKLPPLTVIEAENFEVDYDKNRVKFVIGDKIIAIFNWNNIAGFEEIGDGD